MSQTATESRTGYLKDLDGLRFIAVFAVMITHWTHRYDFHRLTSGLAINGVNLFFVLSGFLISRILMVAKESIHTPLFTLKQFYIRRAMRIFPLYYLVLLIAYIADVPVCRPVIGWLVTYTANIRTLFSGVDLKWLLHFWSLSVEEQFYIFFPLLVLITPKKHLLKLYVSLTSLAVLSRILIFIFMKNKASAEWASYVFTPCCFDCFAIGAILAYLFLYNKDLLKRLVKSNFFYWICFSISFISYYIYTEKPADLFSIIFIRFLFAIFCFWLIGKAALGDFKKHFSAFLLHPAVIYFGKISYGLYIFHNFMPYIFEHVYFPGIEFVYFLVCVGLASLSWKFFEKPINDMKKYFKYA